LLVLIIFAWTPPHFWALAIHRKEEYAAVGIPMLPVTHGNRFTALHILLYTILMCLITLLPYITLLSGWIYAVAATLLGLRFLYWSVEILREKNPDAPMATFKFSITYLMVLFIAMLADHWILGTPV
ncbi:MAG: UbiA family prenyltransferase, partial [Pseudomonadota bacterium]|nr:UbiA family prenyltransferase [Pseudomonadota bacterium]